MRDLEGKSLEELISLFEGMDEEALNEIMTRFDGYIRWICKSVCSKLAYSCKDDEEDLYCEVRWLLIDLLRAGRLKGVRNLDGYIKKSLKNFAVKLAKEEREYKERVLFDWMIVGEGKEVELERLVQEKEEEHFRHLMEEFEIMEMVSSLPIAQRKVLEYRLQGYTEEEIAQELGITQVAVSKLLARARKKLEAVLNRIRKER